MIPGLPSALALLAALLCPQQEPDPPASDLPRFPPACVVNGWYDFRQDYLCQLRAQWSWDMAQRPLLLETISETESLWEPWDTLRDAQHAWDPRPCLASLRRQLGEDAYARGRLPPPVPLWRFRPID